MQKALSVLSTPTFLLSVQSQLPSMTLTLSPVLTQMALFPAGPAVCSGQTQSPENTVMTCAVLGALTLLPISFVGD